MAKKSALARNEKRRKLAEKYAAKRAELKAAGDNEGLQKLPRNSNPNRIKNRLFRNWPTTFIHASFRPKPYQFPRACI